MLVVGLWWVCVGRAVARWVVGVFYFFGGGCGFVWVLLCFCFGFVCFVMFWFLYVVVVFECVYCTGTVLFLYWFLWVVWVCLLRACGGLGRYDVVVSCVWCVQWCFACYGRVPGFALCM